MNRVVLLIALVSLAGCNGVEFDEADYAPDPEFDAAVLQSDVPVLVDFYADWCGPCQTMNPIVSELSEEYQGRAKVVKVDIDQKEGLARRYRVNSIPAFVIFHQGKVVDRFTGVQKKATLTQALDAVVAR